MRKRRIEFPSNRWIKSIRVGDVLKTRSGNIRVVRKVSHTEKHTRVHFTIKHCSWTGRCYTVLGYNDLITLGFKPTGVNVRLNTTFDKMIAEDFGAPIESIQFKCCDVAGIP